MGNLVFHDLVPLDTILCVGMPGGPHWPHCVYLYLGTGQFINQYDSMPVNNGEQVLLLYGMDGRPCWDKISNVYLFHLWNKKTCDPKGH